jgi:hypothetical protein
MLDLFPDRDKHKFHAYMDGRDSLLFKSLVRKLGSEERAQNAFILLGVISEEEKKDSLDSRKRVTKAKNAFPDYVGVTFDAFNGMLEDV